MIKFIEELSMNAWPSLHTYLYDGWVLRVSGGYTKRANSINPLYPSQIDLKDKIDYCKGFYDELDLPTIYKMTANSHLDILDNTLEALGYNKVDETAVKVLDLKGCDPVHHPATDVSYSLQKEWANGYIKNTNIQKESTKTVLRTMLNNIIGKTIWVLHKEEGNAVAFGYGVVDKGYVGIFDIHVNTSYRGKGYGKAVMHKLIAEAKRLGANHAYLQVVVGNKVAENLYDQLGFKEIYRYWYRKL